MPHWDNFNWNISRINAMEGSSRVMLDEAEANQENPKNIIVCRSLIPQRQLRRGGLEADYRSWERQIIDGLEQRRFLDGRQRYNVVFVKDATQATAYIKEIGGNIKDTIVVSSPDETANLPDNVRMLSVNAPQDPGQFINLPAITMLAATLVNLNVPVERIPRSVITAIEDMCNLLTGQAVAMDRELLTLLFRNPREFARRFTLQLPVEQRFEHDQIRQLQQEAIRMEKRA